MKGVTFAKLDGSKLKIAIVKARWNHGITDSLLEKCRKALKDCGVKDANIIEVAVPGSYELVLGAKKIIEKKKVHAVVCLGSLIKGETAHFEYIAEAVTQGIMRLNLDSGVPVVFGVLTCYKEKQAKERSANNEKNHGYAWGLTAVEMALLKVTNDK